MLVTCGFQAQYGEYYVDPMIRVYDLRTNRLLGSCHFQAGATFLKFHPMFSSMLGVASQAGYFQFIDVQQNLITETGSFIVPKAQIYQLDAQGERIEAFDLASSGENVLFGDSGGYLHIWSTNSTSVSPLNKTTRQEQVDYTKLFDQTSLRYVLIV
jgi:PAB-dependent poly(A)-specific ribonuclease subunit 2